MNSKTALNVRKLERKSDERGWLVEVLDGKTFDIPNFGLMFVTTAYPNRVKGNHYHKHKKEWACVIQGTGRLVLEDVRTKEKIELETGEDSLMLVEIPPYVSHGIKNIGDSLLMMLEYTDTIFDEKNPDTYPYKVIG